MNPPTARNGIIQSPESPNGPVWKPDLYRLQREAPEARPIQCSRTVEDRPVHYGAEFHGRLSHLEANQLLSADGDFLVRYSGSSNPPIPTLSFRYKRRTKPLQTTQEEEIHYDKPHNFKTHNFKGLNWCEFCSNFLWGFSAQGVKCEDCGFSAHFKCSEKLPPDCCPELKSSRSVFGVDLTTLVRAKKTVRPFVVDKCIQEIEARGLNVEGIYRISGFADEMDTLRMSLEKDGENADITAEVYDNINVVAGILKQYFRLLPIPLLTYEVHPILLRAVQFGTLREQIRATKDALSLLPPAHYNTLKYLMAHLAKVDEEQQSNKMSAYNLSTVFAPTLMPPPTTGSHQIPDMSGEIKAICLLIQHHVAIF
ncbi:beta-chimaerin isoform X2 [Halyomorpha halys]|uniref:beta-chimaerin isoform X2 n=1 Tax=Halyomorpha halys TaxID=286706 RepID=UPI0006D52077|nr:beta-chimaerin-like isoform X2 [Halyomorpha halys]